MSQLWMSILIGPMIRGLSFIKDDVQPGAVLELTTRKTKTGTRADLTS